MNSSIPVVVLSSVHKKEDILLHGRSFVDISSPSNAILLFLFLRTFTCDTKQTMLSKKRCSFSEESSLIVKYFKLAEEVCALCLIEFVACCSF